MTTHGARPRTVSPISDIRAGVRLLAQAGVPDARELVERRSGKHNLQAHAAHLLPVALRFLSRNRRLIDVLARGTQLQRPLSGRERIWDRVRDPFVRFVSQASRRDVSREIRSGRSLTIGDVARTYLPVAWGGTHESGGAGASTLKRALKIASHVLYSQGDSR